jgi:hypothetical protein
MERRRGMPLRASVPPSTGEGLEAALIGAIQGLAALQLIPPAFVAPFDTYATRLLAQTLSHKPLLGRSHKEKEGRRFCTPPLFVFLSFGH